MAAVFKKVPLPKPVADIYRAVKELEKEFPKRKFTPDGHLVGSIGEVIAAKEFCLTLHPSSHAQHDAYDCEGREVQIKMTAGKSIAMYSECDRLIVLRIASPEEAEVVYDGSGQLAWNSAGNPGKNGQRVVRLSRLIKIASTLKK